MKPQTSNGRKSNSVSKKTQAKNLTIPDSTLQEAVTTLLQEQIINMFDPNKPSTSQPRPRLPSKRRMTESDVSGDEDDGVEEVAPTPTPSAPKKMKQTQKDSSPDSKPYDVQVVLLDGVHENLKTNPKKFLNALKTLKPDLAIKTVRKTASGAMLIHPKEPKDCNSLLKVNAFAPNSVLGLDVKARLPKSQTITHQVIIKNIDADITEEEVKEFLDQQNLPYSNVKRIWSRQRNGPSNMMRLILKDENKKKQLLKNGIYLDQMVFKCVQAKEDVEKKLVFQCWNCQQWNDHKTFECKKETKCVICAGPHRKSDCPKQKTEALCSNCDGTHAAWSTDCPIYQAEVEKKKSFAEVISDSVKTPSFIQDTIQTVVLGMMETIKKQLTVIIAEVVAKAFLEHIYYEAEARKSNGEKYLGATARVTSIVKNATEAANSSPFHELDKSTVNAADVNAEVMKRLQSSMNVTAKLQSSANTTSNENAPSTQS